MRRSRRLTYADADERATRLAHHLAALGIGAGDHVALYLYNGTEYLEGMLAAFKLRAVPINVNYRYGEDELRYLLDDADARAVVFHREFAPDARRRARRAAAAHARSSMVDDDSGAPPLAGAAEYEAALAAASAGTRLRTPLRRRPLHPVHRRHHRHAQGRDVARRGHLLRRVRRREPRRRADHARRRQIVDSLDPHRRGLPACPFMHGTAHWMAFATLYSGGTVVISPDAPVRRPSTSGAWSSRNASPSW